MDRELLADLLAAGYSLQVIGERVGRHPSTVGYWVAKHGLEAAHRETHRARGGIDEAELRTLAAQGLSIRAIAARVGVSYTTVRYWLRRFDVPSAGSERRRRVDEAVARRLESHRARLRETRSLRLRP